MSTLTSTISTSTRRVWHLDVPLTYPALPVGHQLTIALATPHPLVLSSSTSPDLVLACVGGIPVWVAEVTRAGAPASLPMVLLHDVSPTRTGIHITAAQVRVIDGPIPAFGQPEHAHLVQALADLSEDSSNPGPCLLGAATQLDAPIAREVSALFVPVSHAPAQATEGNPDAPAFDIALQHAQPYWALEVPHNYCPSPAHNRLTLFVMTVGHHRPMRPGDLVFAFARKRLVLMARATGSSTPAELKMSVEVSADPRDYRSYITTAEVEVLALDLHDLYDDGQEFLLDNLDTYLDTLFPGDQDMSFGDARPFSDYFGNHIVHTLGLNDDKEEVSTSAWPEVVGAG